ncbi:glycosyltransferase family 2 protein [Hydrogenophaga crocea]|jgi:glycosyltransferase involved in cell wall biosynthesis|uniref:Glycosyltransferase family 2 protein n=1 Tax=Hydrogenophaga crocea TaxID=2716225 RepID=A0A6G8IBY1_9BURK|nr:glycosyltransferase family 2 protein [Hydrogenophaga crocea]QIM50694.1 glycosyltransferase family 2 protein [Hydrogenophaga crocea]
MSAPANLPVSVLVLTRNEERDLPGCLATVAWSDDVHVLDSLSDDRTVALAQAAGATVTQRAFTGYASQRNAGLALPFKHRWVLILDADERLPEALRDEIGRFVQRAPAGVVAARMRRRDIWWGRWLRHSQISPFYVRLVRPPHVRYEREINEVLQVDGGIEDLQAPFDHYPFSKGLDHWLHKHNQYSRMEADLIVQGAIARPSWRIALFGADFNQRRVHQKALFYRLPARPLVKLLYMLLWRRGLLDGMAGVRYALLQCIYEYFIVLKVKEREAAAREPRP